MLRPTVFTSCQFAVALIFFAAVPIHASRFRPYDVVGRAASKAAKALSFINKGGLNTRQQAFAPGNPQYLADVVSWACDTVSPDLLDTCVDDLTAAIQDSTVPYCASAQNELTICLVDQPQDCSDSQVSFDDCANFTIATYDYCIGLGYTTLPELPDCANNELSGNPVEPYDGSAATTTDHWYGYTDSAATTTDDSYDYTDSAGTTTDDYGYGYTESSVPATTTTSPHTSSTTSVTHASSTIASTPSVVTITTSTPIAVPTTQLITYVTIIGTTTVRVTNTTVVPTTVFSLETITTATRTAVPTTTTIVVTTPTTIVTTTTVSGSAIPVTVTTSVLSTIYTCAGGCTHPTSTPSSPLNGSFCVRRSIVKLVEPSKIASYA